MEQVPDPSSCCCSPLLHLQAPASAPLWPLPVHLKVPPCCLIRHDGYRLKSSGCCGRPAFTEKVHGKVKLIIPVYHQGQMPAKLHEIAVAGWS